jgi:hypothetical protein
MQLVGGNRDAPATAVEPLVTKINYFLGNDPNEWHTNVPTFGKVQYDDVYPGIDLVYYGTSCSTQHSALSTQHSSEAAPSHLTSGPCLEYDFVVSPAVDPGVITLNFAGADGVDVNADGDLVLHTAAGVVVQQAPFTYQEAGTARQEVPSRYVIDGGRVSFDVAAYDTTRPLVIDPLVLGYSTYLGAGGALDVGWGMTVDDDGFAYVVGETRSAKFPVTSGAFDETYNGGLNEVFVAKVNADGSGLIYATFLGGREDDQGRNIAIDAAGNAYVTGNTHSRDFPVTPGAFQTSLNTNESYPFADAFVTKLSANGSDLVYSTYLGGTGSDGGVSVTVDAAGNAYVLGGSSSDDFPITPGAFQLTHHGEGDGFVTKLNPAGSALVYSTYLGGTDDEGAGGIAVDTAGNAHVTGFTRSTDFPTTLGAYQTVLNSDHGAYIAKFAPNGSYLAYSTYLAGSDGASADDIAIDFNGNAYVVGATQSDDFPVTPGAYDTIHEVGSGNDGFATKLNPGGSALVYSTYLGGGSSAANGLALDDTGNVYVTGTASFSLETTPDAFQKTYGGGGDSFLMKLNSVGSTLVYSTYLGGSNNDIARGIAVNGAGNVYLTGESTSGDFPTTPNALKRRNRPSTVDSFVTGFAEV